MLAARRLYEQYGRKLDDLAFRSFDELERALRTFLGKLVDRTWPRVKAEQLVRRVLAEEKLGGRGWSEADLPLIDEARALLDGPPQQHGHVIVDEAQDLTPMQLRMLARRSSGRDDDPRRHRAGRRAGRVPPLGGPAAAPRRRARGLGRGAAARLPRPAPGDGARAAAAAADRARRRGADRVSRRRRAAAVRAGAARRARRGGRARGVSRGGARGTCRADRAGEAPAASCRRRPRRRSTSLPRRSRR